MMEKRGDLAPLLLEEERTQVLKRIALAESIFRGSPNFHLERSFKDTISYIYRGYTYDTFPLPVVVYALLHRLSMFEMRTSVLA
jgi:hypothetical protein